MFLKKRKKKNIKSIKSIVIILTLLISVFGYTFLLDDIFEFLLHKYLYRNHLDGDFVLATVANFDAVIFYSLNALPKVLNLLLFAVINAFLYIVIFDGSNPKDARIRLSFFSLFLFSIFIIVFLIRSQYWISFDSSGIREHTFLKEKFYSYKQILEYEFREINTGKGNTKHLFITIGNRNIHVIHFGKIGKSKIIQYINENNRK